MGKGDDYRPVDKKKWENSWERLDKIYGCRYINGRCIYCNKTKPERKQK